MKQIKYIIATFAMASSVMTVGAQTAKSSYFMDGAFHNMQMNPAMKAERNFISFPMLGNMGVSLNGNVGLSDFLYPHGENELATFMHKSVSADEFLGNIPSTTKIGMNFDMTIFALGFRGFGGYNTLNLTLRSQMGINLPKGMFEFMKRGLSREQHSFSNLNVNSMNYAALTIGHCRDIIENLRVGVNLKYLIGLGYANLNVDKMNLTLQDDGIGFDRAAEEKARLGGHLGMASMRERTELLQGSFQLATAPGRGTKISIVLPVDGGAEIENVQQDV